MGNSTISVQQVNDWAKAKGIPVPTDQASGYNVSLCIKLANDVLSDLLSERFNWKWNRKTGTPFYTNSWQQDYPQIGVSDIGWGEDCDRVDINNTSMPKPLRNITWRRELSRTSMALSPVDQICWKYNKDMNYGVWPGAGQVFHPLVAAQISQNPIMSMIDANGNRLIVTTFGTTGSVAPVLPAASAEGASVTDGSVVWKVADPNGQGYRVYPLPGAAGPVWQITPYYQMKSPTFTELGDLIDPVPDDYSNSFTVGYDIFCKRASSNPADRAEGNQEYPLWLATMLKAAKQGDREADSYGMLPATSPVDCVYPGLRNPQDPSQPY